MFKPFLYCNQIKRKLSHLHYEINFVSGDEPNLGSRDLWTVCGTLHMFWINNPVSLRGISPEVIAIVPT